MKLREAEAWLRLGWEVTRQSWDDDVYLRKFKHTPYIEIYNGHEYKKYEPTHDDFYADDWELYKNQSKVNPTLT